MISPYLLYQKGKAKQQKRHSLVLIEHAYCRFYTEKFTQEKKANDSMQQNGQKQIREQILF